MYIVFVKLIHPFQVFIEAKSARALDVKLLKAAALEGMDFKDFVLSSECIALLKQRPGTEEIVRWLSQRLAAFSTNTTK